MHPADSTGCTPASAASPAGGGTISFRRRVLAGAEGQQQMVELVLELDALPFMSSRVKSETGISWASDLRPCR